MRRSHITPLSNDAVAKFAGKSIKSLSFKAEFVHLSLRAIVALDYVVNISLYSKGGINSEPLLSAPQLQGWLAIDSLWRCYFHLPIKLSNGFASAFQQDQEHDDDSRHLVVDTAFSSTNLTIVKFLPVVGIVPVLVRGIVQQIVVKGCGYHNDDSQYSLSPV
jgi:hypothetical protein